MRNKRQVISVHVGQAGIQLGQPLWELYCEEHGVDFCTGVVPESARKERTSTPDAVFQEDIDGSYSPNAVLIDLEPSVVDSLKNSKMTKLWDRCQRVCGKEDAANNFARGRYTVGAWWLQDALEAVAKSAENLDAVHGFVTFHSYGGGTGSGFESLIVERVCQEYPKAEILDVAVFPSQHSSSSALESYNTTFAAHATMDAGLCTVLIDNESAYDACMRKLGVDRPEYSHLNGLAAQSASSLTSGLRFDGAQNVDLSDLRTNLVPFPRPHYSVLSHSPVGRKPGRPTTEEITKDSFRDLKVEGKYLACCLLYRGENSPSEAYDALVSLKSHREINLVDWSPAGFKAGFVGRTSSAASLRSVTLVANTTDVKKDWSRVGRNFDLMYSKKAFVHWYLGEGMEESEFTESREDLAILETEYAALENTELT